MHSTAYAQWNAGPIRIIKKILPWHDHTQNLFVFESNEPCIWPVLDIHILFNSPLFPIHHASYRSVSCIIAEIRLVWQE